MPIYEGANIIDRVKTGLAVITSAYVGVDKVFEYDPTQVLDLTSQEDFNFATWLNAQGVNAANPVIVNFADGQVIGGVTTTAFTVGDISAYSNITFNVSGQIQGAVGGNAVASASPMNIVLNGGTISGAIEEGIQSGSANITFSVNTTGKILAGGGNGGAGGKGGAGDDILNWSAFKHTTSVPFYEWNAASDSSGGIAYNCNTVSYCVAAGNSTRSNQLYQWIGSVAHRRGSLVSGTKYQVSRGTFVSGTGGTGGQAGVGAGYLQARTDGAVGSPGTYRSGNGGKGGDGGDWGIAGGTGNTGGAGLYYNINSSANVRAGASGIVGGSAGIAITSTSAVKIYGGL